MLSEHLCVCVCVCVCVIHIFQLNTHIYTVRLCEEGHILFVLFQFLTFIYSWMYFMHQNTTQHKQCAWPKCDCNGAQVQREKKTIQFIQCQCRYNQSSSALIESVWKSKSSNYSSSEAILTHQFIHSQVILPLYDVPTHEWVIPESLSSRHSRLHLMAIRCLFQI